MELFSEKKTVDEFSYVAVSEMYDGAVCLLFVPTRVAPCNSPNNHAIRVLLRPESAIAITKILNNYSKKRRGKPMNDK